LEAGMADGVEHPVDPLTAFSEGSREGFDSRVTLLLVLGAMYGRGRLPILVDLERNREEFRTPIPQPGGQLETQSSIIRLQERYDLNLFDFRSPFDPEPIEVTDRRRRIMSGLVGELYQKPSIELVGDILLLGIGDPNEFIRVASAISFLDVFDEMSFAVRALIMTVTEHFDELAGQLAETALHRFGSVLAGIPPRAPSVGTSSTQNSASVLVHGSVFSFVGTPIGDWWQPRGDFHTFLKSNFWSDLYSGPTPYTWSGGWSDHARKLAAIELRDWCRNRSLSNFNMMTHSHGGNVAMWATQLGIELDNLVLLSCPAHITKYLPEFTRIKRVISYQIKFDWVIFADGGSYYFDHPQIENRVIPRWFRQHSDSHSVAVWKKYGLLPS
jgi:hypothetical protein